jgi:hypothetical protein
MKLPSGKAFKKFGITISIIVNIAAVIIVLVVIYDVRYGHLNYLTDGNLQVETCNNYFSRTKIKQSGFYQIGNVNFVNTYLTPSEQQDKCSSLNNNVNFQYLVEANNQKALNYYDTTTNFNYNINLKNLPSSVRIEPTQYQVQIPYSSKTNKPISPVSMGLSY